MTKMTKTDKICAAARLLEQGIGPDDLERIRTETGCTRKQAEQIADSMRDQMTFMRWLDRDLRA